MKFIGKTVKRFEEGQKEHGDDWLKVKHKKELMEELLDSWNYLLGLAEYNDTKLVKNLMLVVKTLWTIVDKQIKENPNE